MRKIIVCPHCGNTTPVKSDVEAQKCKWCRRLLSVKVKQIGEKKFHWEVKPKDFPPQIKSLSEYEMEDVYGVQD